MCAPRDPGNWATGLAGGAKYGYSLLFVILISNVLAMFLQHLALKLGVASGRDLAQACRDAYPRSVGPGTQRPTTLHCSGSGCRVQCVLGACWVASVAHTRTQLLQRSVFTVDVHDAHGRRWLLSGLPETCCVPA